MEETYAIELKNVTKRFADVTANDNVNLSVRKGEILSVLGENGSGKTTLMNMIAGIYYPDSGTIWVEGKEVSIRSPKDAYHLGIGMIHQHFKLIPIFTAAENIILGLPGKNRLNLKEVEQEIKFLADQYGFIIDPSKKIYDMSISEKQTVEIIKVLYRGANLLILDEPTAVLTPQETNALFGVLRNMKEAGKSIIIITHKLQEVLEISDRVSVLRKGKYVGTVETGQATIKSLAEMMVGEKVEFNIKRDEPKEPEKRLELRGVSCRNKEGCYLLENISFTAYAGEILGIAGISGSGQKELLECIAGLKEMEHGEIFFFSEQGEIKKISDMNPEEIKSLGITLSFVPEDRLGMGLVASMDLTDNMMIRSYKEGGHIFANRKKPKKLAEQVVDELEVVTPGIDMPVSMLSGGNVQKLLVGREIALEPSVLMAAYPVRGLDIHSSYTIYNLLNSQKIAGVCVLCVGEDLDVLLELCDRILVLSHNKVADIVDARTATKEQLGILMTGGKKEEMSS